MKKSFFKSWKFTALLIVALLCELGVAAFLKPGFMLNGEEEAYFSAEDFFKEYNTKEKAKELEEYQPEITLSSSPTNPLLVDVDYTAEDFANAPAYKATVSNEQPVAVFPEFGIKVDFGVIGNLDNGPDELIVKKLPVKNDGKTGDPLYAYDFSLASGRHEFPLSVKITIPRKAPKDCFSNVLYFNDKTHQCEQLYYEESADGNSYIVSIKHFSEVLEAVYQELFKKGESYRDFINNDVRNGLQKFDPYNGVFIQTNLDKTPESFKPVTVCAFPDFRDIIMHKTEESEKILELYKKAGAMANASKASEYVRKKLGNSVDDKYRTIMMVQGYRNDLKGMTLSFLSMIKKIPEKVADKVGNLLTLYSSIVLFDKVMAQMDDDATLEEIWDNNRFAIAGLGVAIVGIVAGAVSAPVLATACTIIGATITVGSWLSDFINSKMVYKDYTDTLSEEVYRKYMRLPNEKLVPGVTLKLTGEGWATAIEQIFNRNISTPERIADEITKLYNDYAYSFWTDLTDRERSLFFVKTLKEDDDLKEMRNRLIIAGKKDFVANPGKEAIDKFCEKTKEVLMRKTNICIYRVYKDYYAQQLTKMYNEFNNKLVPLLNQLIIIKPKDTSLAYNDPLTKSRYFPQIPDVAIGEPGFDRTDVFRPEMEFTDVLQDPVIRPCNKRNVELDPKVYMGLKADKYRETVLTTTVYHYLQFGCPKNVLIHGNGKDLEDVMGTLEFNEGASEYMNSVYALIKFDGGSGVDFDQFNGVWEYVHEENNKVVEGNGIFLRVQDTFFYAEKNPNEKLRTLTTKKYSYDRRTNTLTLYHDRFKGNECSFRIIDGKPRRLRTVSDDGDNVTTLTYKCPVN
ncbi:MAG: hypothetical protein MJZ69_10655 [Bacteroidaceae bacterium]|nr:hypothetical protein [Bacteroidaceae bacterium]